MIKFSSLKFMNFLSSGNAFTTIQFDAHPTTLVIGKNGSGKSTMLDALCFGLFGKPFRNINKPQLVNSVNQKKCVVEIEFSVGKKAYKIIRGIKPNIFEVYQDGAMIDQDAASKDYQKHLEDNILKLNFKSFTQIVILGVASFTPFMELPAASRREIIEDILDIGIFSIMNNLLKEKVSVLKESLQLVEGELNINMAKTKLQDTFINSMQADRQQRIDELSLKVTESKDEITQKTAEAARYELDREELFRLLVDITPVRLEISGINERVRDLEKEKADLTQRGNLQGDPLSCPTCSVHPEILAFSATIRDLEKEKIELTKRAEVSEDHTTCSACCARQEIQEINASVRDLEKEAVGVTKNVGFYKDHTSCPTCKQNISEELRQEHIDETNARIEHITKTLGDLKGQKQLLGEQFHDAHVNAAKDELETVCQRLAENIDIRHALNLISHYEHVTAAKGQMDELIRKSAIEQAALQIKNEILKEVVQKEQELSVLDNKISSVKGELSGSVKFLTSIEKEKTALEGKGGNIELEKVKLREMASQVVAMTGQRASIKEERDYQDVALALLKDGGVKTRIVKQYLPSINKLVNKYLHAMDFFVSFELNEQFGETIKSRHRDEFSYESFSEGEKQRISLALVFTWRTIAKMKNSTSTNLLILDEVFDSSLDADGTDTVLKLLNILGEETNVWVISHKKDTMIDKFSNVIEFEKRDNYSTMKMSTQATL